MSLEFRCSGAVVKNESLSCNLVTVPEKAIRYFPCLRTLNRNYVLHQIQLVSRRLRLYLFSLLLSWVTHLAVSGLAVFAVEVGPVAVLVPPGSFVRQGTVSDGDVVVSVFRGEGSALVVAQRVTWEQGGAQQREREHRNLRQSAYVRSGGIWLR